MTNIQDWRKVLEDFKKSPQSVGHDLRLDLADIIYRYLAQNGWTQNRLAEAAGMKPQRITKILHGDTNCTFDTAGRLLFALGTRGKLVEIGQNFEPHRINHCSSTATSITYNRAVLVAEDVKIAAGF